MDATLYQLVVARLLERRPAEPGAEDLVLAACEGADALEADLCSSAAPRSAAAAAAQPAPPAAGAYLDSLTVEGFRGVGRAVTLRLAPFPSLTLVVGRNGSGKSSFAEALELLLTGSNRRWEGRSEIWRQGWRNLHHTPARVAADVILEGRRGRTTIERRWSDGADLQEGATTIGGRAADGTLASLGWARALATYRPFLPHNELGALWDEGPSRLHDALAAILGLEDLTTLIGTLSAVRLRLDNEEKQVGATLGTLRSLLEAVDDDRARAFLAATAGRSWQLAAVEAIVAGAARGGAAQGGETSILQQLGALPCPAGAAVVAAVAGLRDVAARLVGVALTDAGRARSTLALLEAAHTHVVSHDTADCPVCGTPGATGAAWRDATVAEMARLRSLAAAAEALHREAAEQTRLAHALLGVVPAAARQAPAAGIDASPLLAAWAAWLEIDAGAGPAVLADHLEATFPSLQSATAAVRDEAAAALRGREDSWRAAEQAITAWLGGARTVAAGAARLRALRAAEQWAKAAEVELRAERFAPIAAAVQRNWTMLRQDSSVALAELRLDGTGRSPRRRVVLDVDVDGETGQALGVMSQGELNALALSLFLPRASLPESPFRFIVVDDPVQAMDPSKVEGLARVLENASATHQVIVFTHDERLPAAVRRLGIDATVVEVQRREGSAVELRRSLDPVRRHIEDALAVAQDDRLPAIARRVVPTFCRLALEAACSEALLRRRLGRGVALADAEAELAAASRLSAFVALALYDEARPGADVATTVQNKWGEEMRAVFARCNRGAHGEDSGDLHWLCRRSERLAELLRALP